MRDHGLIKALKKRNGYGMVSNASFNENEPVLDTPGPAIAYFDRTDINELVPRSRVLINSIYSMALYGQAGRRKDRVVSAECHPPRCAH
jgi:hypothetical protein